MREPMLLGGIGADDEPAPRTLIQFSWNEMPVRGRQRVPTFNDDLARIYRGGL